MTHTDIPVYIYIYTYIHTYIKTYIHTHERKKEVWKLREDEEDDVSSYSLTLRKQEDTVN